MEEKIAPATPLPEGVKRYGLCLNVLGDPSYYPMVDGPFVLYPDHARVASDLTRRLAEVEAERDEHRDNATMLQGRCASALAQLATRERECLATMEQLIGEMAMLRGRAEAAEARVRELEADNKQHEQERIEDAGKIWKLESFKARVIEWAKGRCECCKNYNPENGACPDDCYPGHITAWTPPWR